MLGIWFLSVPNSKCQTLCQCAHQNTCSCQAKCASINIQKKIEKYTFFVGKSSNTQDLFLVTSILQDSKLLKDVN